MGGTSGGGGLEGSSQSRDNDDLLHLSDCPDDSPPLSTSTPYLPSYYASMASRLLRTVPRALPKLTPLHQQRLTPLVSLNIARMATSGTRVATLDASGTSPID